MKNTKNTSYGDSSPFNNLVVLEMANNHMGDYNHGIKMIHEFAEIVKPYKKQFNFAWKFQFRDIDTFIHPSFQERTDIKYVKRFKETKLSKEQFLSLKNEASKYGFLTMCTAFDENSVDLIASMNFDIAKIASCSSTDWPLLNKVSELNIPIISSTAGTKLEDIDNIVSFFQHRNKQLAIMHCIGEYPTNVENLQLNQLDLFKERYKDVTIGFSTHEHPDDYRPVMLAIAKGAKILEKHVAVETKEYPKNAYSSTPEQIDNWLKNAVLALNMGGVTGKRHQPSDKELSDLRQFKRGVFIKKDIKKGDIIDKSNIFYAWPSQPGQLLANDMSKYTHYIARKDYKVNDPIFSLNVTNNSEDAEKVETREKIWDIVQKVKSFITKSGVVIPGKADLEISHHYGVDKFDQTGITMVTVVNREYCKKLIITLPGQNHPEQYHEKKEETFVVLYGDVNLKLDGVSHNLTKGDVITIEPQVRHEFSTLNGCVIEEVSSTHYVNDSYYTDNNISKNLNRKTFITHWLN